MRSLLRYFVPPFLEVIIQLLRALWIFIKYFSVISRNSKFLNTFKNQEVTIVGNGPSILEFSDFIRRQPNIIVMNNFYKSTDFRDLVPVAYCIGEPSSSSAWSDPDLIRRRSKSASYWVDSSNLEKHDPTVRQSFQYVISGVSANPFGWIGSPAIVSLGAQTTAVLALQVAIFMGFKKINLVGFEHSWLATPTFLPHFYSDVKDDDDHISNMSYLNLIESCRLMWKQYECVKVFAESRGIEIVNLTPDTFLDVFSKSSKA